MFDAAGQLNIGVTPIEGTGPEGSILVFVGTEFPRSPFVLSGPRCRLLSRWWLSVRLDLLRSVRPAEASRIECLIDLLRVPWYRRALKLNILRLRLLGCLFLDGQRIGGKELSQAGLPELGKEAEYSSC